MPSVTIPLVGTYNQRGIDGNTVLGLSQDQRFLNCVFNVVANPVTRSGMVYAEKRPGWGVDSLVAAGQSSTGFIKPLSFNASVSAFGDTNSTIYYATTSVGTITGRAIHFKEIKLGGTNYVLIRSSDGTGWYYVDGAKDDLSYVGDTHNGTAVIDSLDSTTGIYVGQVWSGTGVGAAARVLTVDSATQITLTVNSTADGTGITFTKEPIAKILDADFVTTGTYLSSFVEMDGFVFYATDDGNVRNSDLNSVTAYSASNTLGANLSPDEPRAIARQGQAIVVFGSASKEVYSNPGTNATGSPLQRQTGLFQKVGILDQRSLTSFEDEVYFVSSPHEGSIGVYRMRDYAAERISPATVENIIGTIPSTTGEIYASSFRLGGYPYLGLSLATSTAETTYLLRENSDRLLLESGDDILLESDPATTASFVSFMVYNSKLDIWSEWDSTKCTFIDSVGSGTSNQIYATSRVETDGKVYTINPVANGELWQDDGESYTMEVRTAKIDFGTEARKFIIKVTLMGADIQSSGTATLEYSDDDYATWTTAGEFDLTQKNPFITRCGSHQAGRAWRLTHSANTAFRAQALKFDYTVGSH